MANEAKAGNRIHDNADPAHDKNPHVRPLLIHGINYEMIYRLAAPRTVLPFVFMTAGAPVLLAGMVLPILSIASTTSRLGSAPFVAGAQLKKYYMAFGTVLMMASLALVAFSSGNEATVFTLVLFVLATITIGFGQGITGLAYYVITPALVDKNRFSWLMNTQNIVSAAIGILLALYLHVNLKNTNPLDTHMALIWAGAAFACVTSFAVVPIREQRRKKDDRQQAGDGKSATALVARLKKVKDTFSRTIKYRWYRNFLILQVLFLSVSSALPFYSIHAASLHKHSAGALSIFVVAICTGIIVGGPIMIRMSKKSLRMTMVFSGGVAAIAASLAIGLEFSQRFSHYYFYTPVFLLMSLSAQGLSVTVSVYLSELAPESEREYFFATSYFVTGTLGIIAATVLGFLAHFQDEVVPITIILAINLIAVFYVGKLPNESRDEAVPAGVDANTMNKVG